MNISIIIRTLFFGIGFFLSFQVRAIYTPVALTGFNADVVADIPGNAAGSTTADYDNVNYVWMSASYNPSGTYLPVGGLITSVVPSTPGLTYQLQPYTANNTLRMPGTSTGILNFVTPQSAQTVYVLGSTGSGVGTATITITFTDLTTQVFTGVVFPDWYNGANYAMIGVGRTNRVTNVISNDPNNPRLYQSPLALLPSNYGKQIQSVSFSNTGGVLNIMAISIDTPPIPCTGTPTAGTATATSVNPCPGVNVSVSLSGSTLVSNITYQWLQGTNCTAPWLPISGLTNPSALTSILTVSTTGGMVRGYRCVLTCTSTGLTDTSSTACVVVQPWSCTSPCYGASSANNAADQDILNVTVGSLNNSTTCATPLNGSQGAGVGLANRYADFTGAGGVPSPNLFKGLTQSFSLTIGSCGANVASSVKIFIDYNQNASFLDAGEEVYVNTAISSVVPSAVVTGSFVVPTTALNGCTRLRVITMTTASGTISPTGSYGFGETEDYIINIIQPSQYDAAISAISVPAGNCFSANETVTVSLCNFGFNPINLSSAPVTVSLHVNNAVTGVTTYTTVASSGILPPYGGSCMTVVFANVNLFYGGNYTINTSINVVSPYNGNIANDSLNTPVTRVNYRPVGGPDYPLCQGGIIPFGQGLTVSGCATPISDSVDILFTLSPGQPPICTSSIAAPTGACEFASAILPALPAGSSITSDAVLTVTNLASASLGCILCTWPSEKRFSLFQGSAPPSAFNTFFPGTIGNTATTGSNAQGYTYTNLVSSSVIGTIYSALGAGNILKMGSWNTYNTTANNHVINYNGNPTIARLRIYYTYVPANFEWYKDSVGGPVLYTYSPFNPIGYPGSGILNSNTPGTTPFYAACAGSSACRVPVNLVIHPTPVVVQDTLTACEWLAGSNYASFDLTTLDGPVSAFDPSVGVSYFGDQALFLPIVNPSNDTSSTNFIYSKVTYNTTGCYSSDSILLQVNSVPQFISSPLSGSVCYPNSMDVASLINPFTTTAGADTLYFDDPACTIPSVNPHAIVVPDTVYMVLVTNTIPACSDTATAIVDILPASNYIVNQDTTGNFSICGTVGCANLLLADGNTETLYTTTDCRKIATITDLSNSVSLGSTAICEEITCVPAQHNGQFYANRVYEITPSVNDSAMVCLYYLEDDFQSLNNAGFGTWPALNPYSNLCISQVDNGTINTPGHTVTAIPNSAISCTYDPFTTVWKVCFKVDSFSTFFCHTCNPGNFALPIGLLNFNGYRAGDHHVLQWETAGERNADYFLLERSRDGNVFNPISAPIKTKAPGGNSDSPLTYSFRDMLPLVGHNYYRLRQVDLDGQKRYSQVKDLFYGGETIVHLYPNPLRDQLHCDINCRRAGLVNVRLSDATGRTLRIVALSAQEGQNQALINLEHLPNGVYMVEVNDQYGLNYTTTMVKQ